MVNGLITAVQQASNAPPVALIASGFGDAATNGNYLAIANFAGHRAYQYASHARFVLWSIF